MYVTTPFLSHPKYRPDIDGLRAVAVLSVVVFHAFPMWLKGGFIGVDVFFVISGFLISTIIFENLAKGTFSFGEFYARRIRRIFPALLTVLLACYAFGWFALLQDEYRQLGKHIAAGSVFSSNLVLWGEAGYFDNAAETKPLLHLWSLGIEEQFYLVWPFVIWLAWKRNFNLLVCVVAVALVSFVLNVAWAKSHPVATFYLPHARFWELLCGSALAWFHVFRKEACEQWMVKADRWLASILRIRHSSVELGLTSQLMSFLGLLLLIVGFFKINKSMSFPDKWALIPVLGAVLIIAAGANAWINRVLLSNKLAVWFGVISFPLYLWHWPLISFARLIEGDLPDPEIRIGAVILALLLSWLTYRLIERPFRFGGHGGIKVGVLVGVATMAGSVGFITFQSQGLEFRFRNSEQFSVSEIFSKPYPEVDYLTCDKQIPQLEKLVKSGGCWLSKDAQPKIVFLGDSHSDQYRNAAWKWFPDDPLLMIVKTSCLPFAGDTLFVGDCKDMFGAVIDYLEKSSSVETVVLSGYWAYLMSGGFAAEGPNWRTAKPLTSKNIESFERNAHEFLSRVLAAGKKVVFFRDIPDLDFDIRSCFEMRPWRLTDNKNFRKDCTMSEEDFRRRVAPYDQQIDAILARFPQVHVFDPRPVLCKQGRCEARDDSLPFYFNGDHLNHYGTDLVFEALMRQKPPGL